MYDVMATTRVGRSRREMRASKEEDEDFYWSPDRHRTIDRDEVLEMVPALAARDPNDAYLFYDCQTDDVRLVLTILGEAERFGAVMLNGAEVTEVLADERPRHRRRLRRGGVGRADRGRAPTTSSTRPASSPTRSGPRRCSARRTCRGSPPAAAPTCCSTRPTCRWARAACIVPAGEGRMIFSLPWYGRTLVGTTDNDFDGDTDHPRPGERRRRVPARRGQRVLRHLARPSPTWSAPTPGCGR